MRIKMVSRFEKVNLALSTYYTAWRCINRQNNLETITKVQNKKLQKLIRFCYENIKYYKELFDEHHIKPDEIRTASDLIKIPILTKNELRNRFWDFLPHELPASRVSRTSGSTGIPVCILSDRNSRKNNSAAIIRYRQALGIGFFGGAILTPLKTPKEPIDKKAHWTFLQGIHKTFYINPYIENDENAKYSKELINKIKKPVLIGITPALKVLAEKVKDGIFPSFQPEIILTVGESLSQQTRTLLETTFNTKVKDIYACNEGGDVAWQCLLSSSYHINTDNVIVEILKKDKPVEDDQSGEVVITNLNRYAMPIIRYKNGDIARFGKGLCLCGCKLPVITEILGRTGQDISFPNGKKMSWNLLKSPMNHPAIRQFQIIQNEDGSLIVNYIPELRIDNCDIENLLLHRYKDLLGNTIKIEIKKINNIPNANSGKTILVKSYYKAEISQG